MPPIFLLAIVHRLIKEVRRINVELDRVKTDRAIDRSARTASLRRQFVIWASSALIITS